MTIGELLSTYGEIIGGVIGGVIALYAVTTSVRTAKQQVIAQFNLAREEREENDAQANDAVTEWYFARTVDLRTYLFNAVMTLRKAHEALEAGDIRTTGDLKRQVKLQNHALGNGAGAPDLLSEAVLTDFSRIEDGKVRGKITILSTLVNRLAEEERFALYELELALSDQPDETPADDAGRTALKRLLMERAVIAEILLEQSFQLLESLRWRNRFIEDWHRGIERECYAALAGINSEITMPDRLKEAEAETEEPA